MRILPKENLSFSNTFVTENDIDELIKRGYEGCYFDNLNVRNEPLYKKLKETHIIIYTRSEDDSLRTP